MLIRKNRYLLILLAAYCITQIMMWFTRGLLQPAFIITQEIFYFAAIILSATRIAKEIDGYVRRKEIFTSLMAFLVFNFILLLFWLPTVQFNPEINWKLQGNLYEVDPWYYVIYIPLLNFVLAAFVVVITFFLRSVIPEKKVLNKR